MTTHSDESQKPLSLDTLRHTLSAKKGKDYWRSLNELAESDEFEELVRQEFPRQAGLLDHLSRRDFLKLLGGSLAMAGLAACVPQSAARILPYVKPPEELIPGKPLYYASSMVQDGLAKGVLITTTMGRPIKIDGNPKHPASLGTSDIFMQASILDLYDPDRAKQIINQGAQKSWQDFVNFISGNAASLGQGAGLRILGGDITSPTLISQIKSMLSTYPQAKVAQYSPVGQTNRIAGINQAFGKPYDILYDFSKADVVLSLDCDFMFTEPGHIRYSHDFMARHQPVSTNGVMNRLYVIESSMSLTGSNADHRLGVRPGQVETFAREVASRLGTQGAAASGSVPGQNWLDPLVADLKKAGKSALVIVGERQPASVHALALAMNQTLGSIGNTVALLSPNGFDAGGSTESLAELVQELNSGQINTLVILEGNPVYTAPADLNFAAAMKKAKQVVYLAAYMDETASQSTWVIPAAHYTEMWGDALSFDGTVSLIQPVIEPLYGGKSPIELTAAFLGQGSANGYDLVRQFWQSQTKSGSFDQSWQDALGIGMVANSAKQPVPSLSQVNPSAFSATQAAAANGLDIVFEPDYTIWDGRFTNNAWLQELPKPLTKLTWDNAAFISPNTASRLSLSNNDGIELKLRGRSIQAAVYIEPGQPDDVVTVTLGYGRKEGGSVLQNSGYNAYAIRTSQAPWFDHGLEVTKTGQSYSLVTTHEHWSMENRDLVREATLSEYQAHPNFAQVGEGLPLTLYGNDSYPGYAWGMAINLNTCIGCNACVVACQAENNIPTVGKDQVSRGREMHWLRIDRYYKGSPNTPQVVYEPVPCMHCEKAPCEPVCPVEATSHSAEGLNEMTYNRCVGTRYCSNNCPYKVRRFNFYKYNDDKTESLKAMRNPDVTVRMRGVMEKCTYCVQRINQTRIQADVEGRKIKDGEIRTACQQACPTGAIVFGNINDPNSEVRKLKETPLNYALLGELGTRPRTTYQAKVRNPNPLINEQA